MSTLLQTLAVVVISIAAATAITVKDPEQPATIRSRKRQQETVSHAGLSPSPAIRLRRPRERGRDLAAQRPEPAAARPLWAPATVEGTGFSDHWVPAPVGPTLWTRIRSGLLLGVLLALIGTLVAAALGGLIVFVAVVLRSAVA